MHELTAKFTNFQKFNIEAPTYDEAEKILKNELNKTGRVYEIVKIDDAILVEYQLTFDFYP